MSRARGALSFVIAALVAGGAAPSDAHDHREPRAFTLEVGESTQRGHYIFSTWTAGDRREGVCMGWHGDGIYGFPHALGVPLGPTRVRIVLPKRHRPDTVVVQQYRGPDPSIFPRPPGMRWQRVRVKLSPRRDAAGDVIAWIARFTVDAAGEHYLEAYAAWRDRNGCGVMQDALYTFHLRSPI